MNAKETTTIRQALRLITTGETLTARRMLAQLTIASQRSPMLRDKAPKPAKPCYLCKRAIDARVPRDYWISPAGRKYIAMPAHPGCVKKAEIERDRIWAENDAKRAAGFWLAETITWIVLIWLWTRRRRKPRIWR